MAGLTVSGRVVRAGAGVAARAPLVVALALVLVAGAHVWVQIATPSDGAHAAPGRHGLGALGLQVEPLRSATDGLRSGDVVVAVDGVPLETLARRLFAAAPAPLAWRTGDRVRYDVLRDGATVTTLVELGRYPLAEAVRRTWGTMLFALVHGSVALLLVLRRPELPAIRVLGVGAAALLAATTWSFGLSVADLVGRSGFWLYHLGAMLGYMLFWTTGLHFALLFPRRLRLAGRPGVLALLYLAPYALLGLYLASTWASAPTVLAWLAGWAGATGVHASALLTLTLIAIGWQFATVRAPSQRAQITVVVLAALVAGGAGLVLYQVPPLLGASAVHPNVIGVLVAVFPLAIAFAVLRRGLFDVDRLIGQTVVYGTLTLVVTAVYVVVVGVLGAMLRTGSDLLLGLLATGVVAVGFQSVRQVLQRAVDQRMFGDRDDPLRMLERLGARLEATADVERLLPALVETVAVALRLPYVAVRVAGAAAAGANAPAGSNAAGGATEVAASYGRPLREVLELPLHDGDEEIGWLLAAPRERGTELSASDRRVLEAVARQAGGAVRRVQLTAELRRSHAELVRLREEERRRLRRDLHDGLGPSLAALGLKVDAARNLLERAPERTVPLLDALGADVQAAVAEVRRVAEGLRPPSLDDLGLVGALQERAHALGTSTLQASLEAVGDIGPLPAAVEVAAYFIAVEAMTNALRHADARTCRVTISRDRALHLAIVDDGRGIPSGRRAGVGLHSMRERAAEVGGRCRVLPRPGGGTQVVAVLPLPEAP